MMVKNKYNMIDTKEDYYNKILQYRQRGYEYLQEIDGYLNIKDQVSVEAYLSLFLNEEFQNYYVPCLAELGYAQIFAAITLDELKNGRTIMFISHGNSIRVLMRFYTKLKFLLWNLEFKITDDAEAQLYDFLDTNQVSPEAIKVVLSILGFDARTCYLILIANYLAHQKFSEAIRLFEYAAEKFPGDQEIIEPLVKLCTAMGDARLAGRYEEQLRQGQSVDVITEVQYE